MELADHSTGAAVQGELSRFAADSQRPTRPNMTRVTYYQRRQLAAVLGSLTVNQITGVLRHRYVPVESRQYGRGCIVTDQASVAAAIAQGRRIVGWTRQSDLLNVLHNTCSSALVDKAGYHLARNMPQYSAERQLTVAQTAFGLVVFILLLTGFWWDPAVSFSAIAVMCCGLFLSVAAVRAASLIKAPQQSTARSAMLGDDQLPVYTVMVALFREVEVAGQLVNALKSLNYPAEKLDIKLVLEQEDITTRRHLAALDLPSHFEVLVVPHSTPQTKPKALNYALSFARGELLAIYDAEDIPDRDQLRVAANAFARAPHSMACLQARLSFYNTNENWLTRQFAIEYAALFDLLLPMLANAGLPMPLGGTSNHFRISVLRKIGGWDAHNVTEDADLGLRLARLGWQVGVIDSTTCEEANCQFDNWLHQRARWLKGWMQTWLVHMRSPVRLWRDLGAWRFVVAQIMMLGMIVTALLHPVFLAYAVWSIASGSMLNAAPGVLSSLLIGFGLVVLVAGYGFALAAGAKGLFNRNLGRLWLSLAGMPVYWLLVSLGGWLALWQLISSPHHWNKTAHGLSRLVQNNPAGPQL